MRANGRPVSLYAYAGETGDEPWHSEKCDTYAGWLSHYRNGEAQCERSRRARNQYMKEWRLRTGRVKSIRVRLTPAQLALLCADNGYSVNLDGE